MCARAKEDSGDGDTGEDGDVVRLDLLRGDEPIEDGAHLIGARGGREADGLDRLSGGPLGDEVPALVEAARDGVDRPGVAVVLGQRDDVLERGERGDALVDALVVVPEHVEDPLRPVDQA